MKVLNHANAGDCNSFDMFFDTLLSHTVHPQSVAVVYCFLCSTCCLPGSQRSSLDQFFVPLPPTAIAQNG